MSRSASSIGGKTKHKLVFLGDQGTGKSSIIERFINDHFDEKSNPTIGIDFLAKNFVHNNRNYRLQLWDTAGQQRFKSLIPGYLKDAVCGIFVYDVTNEDSMLNVEKWISLYKENKPTHAVCVLCANKIDLREKKTLIQEKGEAFAKSQGIPHFQVSAKSGLFISEMFGGIIDTICNISKDSQETLEKKPQSLAVIPQKEAPKNAYDFTQVSPTTRSTTVRLTQLTPEELEEDRKLLVAGRSGCCKV